MEIVTVRVPATSANIGPGFDSLGCALSLYNTFTFTPAEKNEVTGCDPKYAGDGNLALVAFRAACAAAGREPIPVRLHIEANVPVSRGLGSSATLLVAGAMGADALLELHLGKTRVFEIVAGLEGHPDNVAPAVFGGFTAALLDGETPRALSCPVDGKFRFCALIPDFETSTHDARAVLPKTVPYADAVFNSSHVAVLLAALAAGDVACVRAALHDRLHEPYRRSLIDGFADAERICRAAGADAFFLSGSGSTCMALYTDPAVPDRIAPAMQSLPHHWRVLPLTLDTQGAVILKGDPLC